MELSNPLLIVVDPGHGGYDNGAMWEARPEKDDNLRLGLAVRDALLYQGVDVLMTRETDEFISLADRATMANNADADLFISIHRNSYTEQTPSTNGVENYIYLTAPEETSGRAARLVLEAVVDVGVQSNRGVSRGNYYVLRKTKMPAMLLEMGFIINDEDNRLFDENLDAYAQAIARGAMEYFGLTYIPPSSAGAPGGEAVPPIGTVPPVTPPRPPVRPVPPIGTLPPVEPVPPIGTLPPVEPVPPIGTLPPVEPVPPIATLPPVEPVPPIGTLPPVEPVPPIGELPQVQPVTPIGELPQATLPGSSAQPRQSGLAVDAQRTLNGYFGAGLEVDGVYGPATRRALTTALQAELNAARNAGLTVDGQLGEPTRAALPTLRQGDTGNLVLLLQILLALRGYDAGGFGGIFDAATKTSVQMFQRDHYLVPDGVAGPRTLNMLLS